jgi:hypothetical protein
LRRFQGRKGQGEQKGRFLTLRDGRKWRLHR